MLESFVPHRGSRLLHCTYIRFFSVLVLAAAVVRPAGVGLLLGETPRDAREIVYRGGPVCSDILQWCVCVGLVRG